MFYFLLKPIIMYNWILIAAAVIPAIFLMVKVYRSDRREKESPWLMKKLVIGGVLATLIALIEERVGERILSNFVEENTVLYNIILYFVIVALSEESSKYIMMKRYTWNSMEFNCQYDGVVYAAFTSLGFALWENINYVLTYGFSTAIVRAVTAIPGHACFGVFMGIFYGVAKRLDYRGKGVGSRIMRFFAVIIPALIHGAYDYIATMEEMKSGWYFVLFVVILFAVSFLLVGKTSKNDRYIDTV